MASGRVVPGVGFIVTNLPIEPDRVVVTANEYSIVAIGKSLPYGASRFLRATLRPKITVNHGADLVCAVALHQKIHKVGFIARSVVFPVTIEATFSVE